MNGVWKLMSCQTPFALNKWLQKGQGIHGCGGEDYMTDTRETPSGCDEQGGNRADGLKEDERISWSKLRRMGMIGEWMEVEAQLGIGVKLITNFPSSACWEGWDAWWCFGDKKPTWFTMFVLALTYSV